MKKRIVITLAFILTFLVGISVAGIAMNVKNNEPQHPSDYHIGVSYDKAVKSDKPVVALFYVDWCGYCMKFMPKFQQLSKMYKGKYNFVMVNVESEDSAIRALTQDVGIGGFPTVYILDPKYDNRVLMPNIFYHNIPRFKVELDRYLRIRQMLDSKESK